MKKFNRQTLILIGYKASGKTTLGQMLANHLNYQFLDTDTLFEKTYNIKPHYYYQQHGEADFRKLESKILQNLTNMPKTIISTGGGIVENPLNIEHLKKMGTILYLHVEFDKILTRLERIGRSPAFVNLKHYQTRDEKYKLVCDQMIHLSFESVDDCFTQLVQELGECDG